MEKLNSRNCFFKTSDDVISAPFYFFFSWLFGTWSRLIGNLHNYFEYAQSVGFTFHIIFSSKSKRSFHYFNELSSQCKLMPLSSYTRKFAGENLEKLSIVEIKC